MSTRAAVAMALSFVVVYASIYQEIKSKGKDSRFRKTEWGKFASTSVA